ncbi:hypothetical protein CN981_09450 [Priestia megaterium]|nr:hypothetical protein CN981_09450 [Priestia megaterium]
MLEQKVLDAYADGSSIEVMSECFNITSYDIIDILQTYKENSRYKKSFTDEFKQIVAQRDSANIPRSQIAKEFGVTVNTVKKACEQFGQALKEKANSDNAYSKVEGVDNLDICPNCKSKKVNEIDSITEQVNTSGIYCMDCGNEYFTMNDVIYKVNFEYLPEN